MVYTHAAASQALEIAQAIKASGAIVRLEPDEFQHVLERMESPLVVIAEGGFFSSNYQYLTSYKGLTFYCKSRTPLNLPPKSEAISSRKIWIPT